MEYFQRRMPGSGKYRVYGPKPPNNMSIGRPCYWCKDLFKQGDLTCLAPLQPSSERDFVKWAQGLPYVALSVEVHAHHVIVLGDRA